VFVLRVLPQRHQHPHPHYYLHLLVDGVQHHCLHPLPPALTCLMDIKMKKKEIVFM